MSLHAAIVEAETAAAALGLRFPEGDLVPPALALARATTLAEKAFPGEYDLVEMTLLSTDPGTPEYDAAVDDWRKTMLAMVSFCARAAKHAAIAQDLRELGWCQREIS